MWDFCKLSYFVSFMSEVPSLLAPCSPPTYKRPSLHGAEGSGPADPRGAGLIRPCGRAAGCGRPSRPPLAHIMPRPPARATEVWKPFKPRTYPQSLHNQPGRLDSQGHPIGAHGSAPLRQMGHISTTLHNRPDRAAHASSGRPCPQTRARRLSRVSSRQEETG